METFFIDGLNLQMEFKNEKTLARVYTASWLSKVWQPLELSSIMKCKLVWGPLSSLYAYLVRNVLSSTLWSFTWDKEE